MVLLVVVGLLSLLSKAVCKPCILDIVEFTVDKIFPWLSLNCNWLELSCNCVPTEPIKKIQEYYLTIHCQCYIILKIK